MNKVIYTNNAPEPIGPYSQAIQNNSMLFLSGQLPIDPKTGIIESDNIEHQTKQIWFRHQLIILVRLVQALFEDLFRLGLIR